MQLVFTVFEKGRGSKISYSLTETLEQQGYKDGRFPGQLKEWNGITIKQNGNVQEKLVLAFQSKFCKVILYSC